ncbi:MAG: hypothetical protein Q8L79_01780 [Methylobacter sp.]|uniref:EF-hand domain-containing protein n=1 Tax=Methylobacter sp. TaxID=2051955 RepID=UPI00272FB5E5|nr:hypothetical protein [Methylobacter sp.]MDP1663827.1 hypothetical protein [Methylobacter sp.]
MKIKKNIYEISDVIKVNPLDQTNLNFFKIFSLPLWLVIISISLGFASKSVRAGTEDADLYYRYVPYQGPSSATGTGSQTPKQSSGASETEVKKAEQATTSPSEKGGEASQAPKQSSGASETEAKKAEQATTSPGEKGGEASQAPAGQSTEQSNAPKTEDSAASEHKLPVQRPETGTGEFPSPTIPSFTEIDVNGDHYVTKDELQNFPELLRVFDKIDAGKDGRLEQHEFANLEMETSREGEI